LIEESRGSLERLGSVEAFAMDMDGTVYLGERLLPGAVAWMEALDGFGLPVVFLTNNSSRSRRDYVDRLTRLGLSVTHDNVMTSGEAAIHYLNRNHPGAGIHVVGTTSLKGEFKDAGLAIADSPSDADVVVLGFDTTLTYRKLVDLCDLVRNNVPFIATHPDMNCPVEHGYIPDVGSFLALVEASTGRRPDAVTGKPDRLMIEALCDRIGLRPEAIAYVGDRLYTDIAMGRASGMLSILVLTGETSVDDIGESETKPDLVVDDLVELRSLWEERNVKR